MLVGWEDRSPGNIVQGRRPEPAGLTRWAPGDRGTAQGSLHGGCSRRKVLLGPSTVRLRQPCLNQT